jgi:cell division protein FtsW (lipid II flippase)
MKPLDFSKFLSRLPSLLLVFLLFFAGWVFIADQQAYLWIRLPASTVDRFVADQISIKLPRLPAALELQAACAQPLSWQAEWRQAWLRAELAQCLSAPDGMTDAAAAQKAIVGYEGLIAGQVKAAQAWLAQYDVQGAGHRLRLQQELAGLQSEPWGLLPASPTSVREIVGAEVSPDRAANALRQQMVATQARVESLRNTALPAGERARHLALLATGLQLVTDYGVAPPAVHLTTARDTLADALEWQRRASAYQERGFKLAELKGLPGMVLASGVLLLLVVAVTCGGSALAVGVWAIAIELLALGSLMLTDVALSGAPSLRYLAARQFLSFGVANGWLPLVVTVPLPTSLNSGALVLWWPLLWVAAALIALRAIQNGTGWALAPLRAWVRWGDDLRWGALQSALLLAAGTLVVLFLGMPAAVSELLILLGCVGVASYLARQAAHANVGAGLQSYSLVLVGAALALAVGGSVARGDLGHALVAMLLTACFAWLFGWGWLRMLVLAGAAGTLAALAACLMAGKMVGPLAWLAQGLPPHAQDRIDAMFDPFHAGSSDLARVRWLMQSADLSGWAMGYAPWQGLAPAGLQDGLPLQGPSDYVLALATTLWGHAGGLLLMALVLAVFAVAAVLGLRTALRAAMPAAVRWLAAVGGFGCVVMAAKVVLSVGGVTGVLPLTGLPVGLLGYGPVTHMAALLYLALALGTLHVQPIQTGRGVHVKQHQVSAGAVRRRGLGLALVSAAGLGLLLVLGFGHLRSDRNQPGQHHIAQARFDLAQAVTQTMRPSAAAAADGHVDPAARLPCDELGNAVAAWNKQLAYLPRPVRVATDHRPATVTDSLRLDATRLLQIKPVDGHRACRTLARTLGEMLTVDLSRLVGRPASLKVNADNTVSDLAATQAGLSVFDKPRAVGARPLDYTTANAWWGQPGCVVPAQSLAILAKEQAHALPVCAKPLPVVQTASKTADSSLMEQVVTDAWLQRNLAPQVFGAMRIPTAEKVLNHHAVAVGPVLGMTLVPAFQHSAQLMVDCATGRLHGADCATVLPQDAAWQQRHYGAEDALRAGAMGLVMAEVDSGRVVALAGAVSDCTLDHLGQAAKADASGHIPALAQDRRCAQLPDQRSSWLAQQHPALWMVPPGSALKPFALVAGIDAAVIGAEGDAYWKGILAESHERLPIQRAALAAGQRYLDVLGGLGFGQVQPELLWGGMKDSTGESPLQARWNTDAYMGTKNLRATSMPLAQAEQIRSQKERGINVDKLYGKTVTAEFVAARRLADASVGGGDIRINALGLVDAWRALDLRARS